MILTAPLLLLALAGLPLLWWLLRATPPAPRVQSFPALRLLSGLPRTEETPARTPPWLLLLRMAAAALLIVGLAGPVLNADRGVLPGAGPVLLAIDDGWASAGDWPARLVAAQSVLDRAERAGRVVSLLATAPDETDAGPRVTVATPAAELRPRLAALRPKPWPVDHVAAAASLAALHGRLPGAGKPGGSGPAGTALGAVVYVADGLAGPGAAAFAQALLDAGPVATLSRPSPSLGLMLPPRGEADRLVARVALLPRPNETRLAVLAEAGDGRALARAEVVVPAQARMAELPIVLPVELRNQLTRLVLEGPPSAGGVMLLDERTRRRPVGLIATDAGAETPLTGPSFFLDRALAPVSELRHGDLGTLLSRQISVLVLTDGPVSAADARLLRPWIEKGGLLLRFAGPRLAGAGAGPAGAVADPAPEGEAVDTAAQADADRDPDGDGGANGGAGEDAAGPGLGRGERLLPVPLLAGDRQLGGAMSWSQPAGLAPFPAASPFIGLPVPAEVTVTRQVLAEPTADLAEHSWARLADGTPLVTERALGRGRIVLFHVTANADWSNLPLSGLFVGMLDRLVQLAAGIAPADDTTVLAPVETLDGSGVLGVPPVAASGLAAQAFASTVVSPRHPPGLYGPENNRRALNLASVAGGGVAGGNVAGGSGAAGDVARPVLREAAGGPGVVRSLGEVDHETPLGPWLVALAVALLAADLILGLWLRGLLGRPGLVAALAAAFGVATLGVGTAPVRAETVQASASQALVARSGRADRVTVLVPPAAAGQAAGPAEAPGPRAPLRVAAAGAPAGQLFPGQTPIGEAPTQSPALATHLAYVVTNDADVDETSLQGLSGLSAYVNSRTAAMLADPLPVRLGEDDLSYYPLLYWPVTAEAALSAAAARDLNAYLAHGGIVVMDTRGGDSGDGTGSGAGFAPGADAALRRLSAGLQIPPLAPLGTGHVLSRSFYLLSDYPGRFDGAPVWVSRDASLDNDGVSPVIIGSNDWAAAWAVDAAGRNPYATIPGGNRQRTMAYRFGVNLVIYALTGNYKADQVHVPALLQRLGQ